MPSTERMSSLTPRSTLFFGLSRTILFLFHLATTTTLSTAVSLLRGDSISLFVTTIHTHNKRGGSSSIGCNRKMWSAVSRSLLTVTGGGGKDVVINKSSSLIPRSIMMSLNHPSTFTSLLASLTTDSTPSSSSSSSQCHRRTTLQPLVVCGPSGVGKGTIISRFMEMMVNGKKDQDADDSISSSSTNGRLHHHHQSLLPEFKFSVSHTTRPPRIGEIHGVHYHFVTREYMLSKIYNDCSSDTTTATDVNNTNNDFFVEHAQVHGNLYGTSFQSIYDASSSYSSGSLEKGVAAENVGQQQQRPRECLLDIDFKGVRSIKEFQLRQQQQQQQRRRRREDEIILANVVMSNNNNNNNNIRLGKERSTQQYIIQPPISAPPDRQQQQQQHPQLPLLDPKYVFIAPPNLETLRERLSKRNTETPESLELRLRNAQDEMEYGMTKGNFDAIIVNDDLDRACHEFVKVVEKLYTRKDTDERNY